MPQRFLDRFVNLDSIADGFFRDAVVDHVSVYCDLFDERLVSVYVWGSVHRNEAVPEVSDLDLHPFVIDAVTDADRFQLRESEASLRREFLSLHGLATPRSIDRVSGGRNATLPRCHACLGRGSDQRD